MLNYIRKILGAKKEYKNQMARAEALPEEYRFVFRKIHGYIWRFAGGDGTDMMDVQNSLIELFETGAAEGRHVLDVTGEDVAAFCDEFLRDAKKWTDGSRRRLNNDLNTRLGKEGDSV